jgi:hypothetical protein
MNNSKMIYINILLIVVDESIIDAISQIKDTIMTEKYLQFNSAE